MSIIVYISMFFDVIIFLYGLNFNFKCAIFWAFPRLSVTSILTQNKIFSFLYFSVVCWLTYSTRIQNKKLHLLSGVCFFMIIRSLCSFLSTIRNVYHIRYIHNQFSLFSCRQNLLKPQHHQSGWHHQQPYQLRILFCGYLKPGYS